MRLAAIAAVALLAGCATPDAYQVTVTCDPSGAKIFIANKAVGFCGDRQHPIAQFTPPVQDGPQRLVFDVRWRSGASRHVDHPLDPDQGYEQELDIQRPFDHPGLFDDSAHASIWNLAALTGMPGLADWGNDSGRPIVAGPPLDLSSLRASLAPPPRVDVYLHPPSILEPPAFRPWP